MSEVLLHDLDSETLKWCPSLYSSGSCSVTIKAFHFIWSSNCTSSYTCISLCADTISSASIKPPVQAGLNGTVPTGISLAFRANKTTQYNTDLLTSLVYRWTFSDSSDSVETTDPVVFHVFYAPGTFQITLEILAANSPSVRTTYTITVYESKVHPWDGISPSPPLSCHRLPSLSTSPEWMLILCLTFV